MAETTEKKGQGCDRSLGKAKEFQVAIGNLLCRDRISWGRVVKKQFYFATWLVRLG